MMWNWQWHQGHTKLVSISASKVDWWCSIGGVWLVYGQKDVTSLFISLPLLQKLFPNPLEPLLPAALLKNKGKMTLAQMQTAYWNGRNQMVFDRRVRFDALHFGLWWMVRRCSVHLASLFQQDGVRAHARYKELLKLEKDYVSMDKKESEDLTVEMLGANLKEIQKLQEQQQNYVLNRIIDRNPGCCSLACGENLGWQKPLFWNLGEVVFVFLTKKHQKPQVFWVFWCGFRSTLYCTYCPTATYIPTGFVYYILLRSEEASIRTKL